MTDEDQSTARRRLIAQLASWRAAGVTHLPRPVVRVNAPLSEVGSGAPSQSLPPRMEQPLAAPTPAVTSALLPLSSEADMPRVAGMKKPERIAALTELQQEVAKCKKCKELACTRTQTVFGVGNPTAKLCFLGEAPGADEDEQGEPFVGRAGQLLNKIIEACKLRRSDVYILNVLKCRPPNNRTPEPDEVDNCRDFLDKQLQIIRPEFICCLGAVAAKRVIEWNTSTSLGKLRGRFFDYKGIAVAVTYHPAYLLRNPAAKKDTWEDMKLLMKRMGVDL